MRPGRRIETCPECGCPAVARTSARGSVMEHHEPGGKLCKAAAWGREADARGLVRVVGEAVTDLSSLVEVVYGPYNRTLAEVPTDDRGRPQGRPGVVSAAWAPRWAVVLAAAFGSWPSKEKKRAFKRAAAEPEWRDALLSVADLAGSAEDARRVVVAFCKGET